MTYSFELDKDTQKFVEAYASETGENVGELAKKILLDHIEDIMDLRLYEQSKAEYDADPETYSLDEIEKELMSNAL